MENQNERKQHESSSQDLSSEPPEDSEPSSLTGTSKRQRQLSLTSQRLRNSSRSSQTTSTSLPQRSELEAGQFILMRHGFSQQNCAKEARGRQSFWDETLIDAELDQRGIEQCLNHPERARLHETDLACVLVSPMRRAMQTAYYLLRDHPNFATMRFVLAPQCREHLHTAGDIPLPHSEGASLAQSLFPNVDTESCFADFEDKEAYYTEDLFTQVKQQIATKAIEQRERSKASIVLEMLKKYSPHRIDAIDAKLQRAEDFRKTVKQVMRSVQLSQDQKVLIVAHAGFTRYFTRPASERNETGINGARLENCQMMAVDQFLQ